MQKDEILIDGHIQYLYILYIPVDTIIYKNYALLLVHIWILCKRPKLPSLGRIDRKWNRNEKEMFAIKMSVATLDDQSAISQTKCANRLT